MTDLVGVYCKSKNKTFIEYVGLISKIISVDHKKFLGNKRKADEIIAGIVDIYVDKYLFVSDLKYDMSKMFIQNNYINEYGLTREVNVIAEYFMKNKMIFDIDKNEKEIILMAVYLQMANKLDILTSPFNEKGINFNNMIFKYLDEYHKIDFIFLVDQGKKSTKLLIDSVKRNAIKENKVFETLTSKKSFNKYIKITSEDNYITQYNYYIDELDDYDAKQSTKLYLNKNIDDKFTLISTELVMVSLLKEFSIRKNLSTFFIPIKKKFLLKEKNIKELSKIFTTKINNRHIKILINYNELDNKLIEVLKSENIDFYVYCNKTTILKSIDINQKYIFSKEFLKNSQIVIGKEDNVIIETSNIFAEDNELVSLKNKENE